MKLRWVVVVLLLSGAATYNGGERHEANRIQATCESDRAITVINDTEYVCLSRRQIEMLQRHDRGASGTT